MAIATQPVSTGTTWQLDASHSSVEFAVKHLMIATVKGRFGGVVGTIQVDEDGRPSVDATIDVTTISTHSDQRDAHLRSPDFFDVESFPTIRFVAGKVEGDVTGRFALTGDITIRGVTRPITLDVTAEGTVRDPWGGERAVFSAKGVLRRSDFGLRWNQALEAGGVAVGDDVKIAIEAELVKA
jgi:polyisoprenoid-binding protein YceI